MTDMSGVVIFRNPVNDAGRPGAGDQEPEGQGWSADYLRARERAERAAAKRAQSSAARHVHQELALHYAELAKAAG